MRFKSYENFVNEGFVDKVKNFIKKVGEFFSGVGSKFLNALIHQKNKDLPKGVTFYPSKNDLEILKDNGVSLNAPKLKIKDLKEERFIDHLPRLDEAVIQTKYPDIGKVKDVDSKGLDNFIRDTLEGGKGVKPLLVWGAPGIGKTAIINAIAKEYFGENAREDKRLIEFDLMTMSPEDFFIPSIKDKDKSTAKGVRLPDEWLPVRRVDDKDAEKDINGPDGKGGILFFDEIARCSTKVQNVCLKLIDERRIGNYVLGEKWVILSCANRKNDLSDDEQEAFHWSSTLANRFQQINYATTLQDWTPWATSAKDDLGDLIVQPEIVAFLRFNQKYFHLLDPENFSNSSGGSEAWPSPRTWTNAAAALKARENRYKKSGTKLRQSEWDDEQEDILSANVGSEAASAFIGFKKLIEKINPEDIKLVWTNASKAPKWKATGDSKLQIDQIYALIAAACFQMKDTKKLTKGQADNFTQWLCLSGDAPNSIKAINMMYEIVPSLKEDDYFQGECKNKLVDKFPSIFNKEK